MKRREFIAGLGGAAAWPVVARAQQAERSLGLLMSFSQGDAVAAGFIKTLRQSLAELGWREGVNLKIEFRGSQDDARMRAYAKELVGMQPDVILAHGPTFQYVREATRAVPIVFVAISDPVGQGFVSSLAHPGGNATGLMLLEFSVGGKFIELMKEIAPHTKRVAVFEDPLNSTTPQWWRSIEGAARDIGIEPQQALVRSEVDIDVAIKLIASTPNGGIIVPPQAFLTANRAHLIALAARERLPVVYSNASFVRDGGLLSYGANLNDQYARAASYVDRILKGAKPNDLPVQAPTKFELAINLKTAKALGLTVPPALLARADEVIE